MSFFKKKNSNPAYKPQFQVKSKQNIQTDVEKQPLDNVQEPIKQEVPNTVVNIDKGPEIASMNEDLLKLPAEVNMEIFRTQDFSNAPPTLGHSEYKTYVASKYDSYPKSKSGYTPKPLYEKCNAVIFVVENTEETNSYSNDILRLINKIVDDNSSSLFMFLKIGNQSKFSELLSYDQLKAENLQASLLSLDDTLPEQIDLAHALAHIQNFVSSHLTHLKFITVNDKQYYIIDVRIIFIGTGRTDDACTQKTSLLLKSICSTKGIKVVKYFCIKDQDAINAAAIGFPIIGHIESNFYK